MMKYVLEKFFLIVNGYNYVNVRQFNRVSLV